MRQICVYDTSRAVELTTYGIIRGIIIRKRDNGWETLCTRQKWTNKYNEWLIWYATGVPTVQYIHMIPVEQPVANSGDNGWNTPCIMVVVHCVRDKGTNASHSMVDLVWFDWLRARVTVVSIRLVHRACQPLSRIRVRNWETLRKTRRAATYGPFI